MVPFSQDLPITVGHGASSFGHAQCSNSAPEYSGRIYTLSSGDVQSVLSIDVQLPWNSPTESFKMIATKPATTYAHPLDPATPEEIEAATRIIKKHYKDVPLHFKAAGLEEPTKALMVKYLEAEHTGQPLPDIPRNIFAMWYIKHTPRLFEAIVDVTSGSIGHHVELPRDFHGPVDRTELNEAAQVVLADPNVQAELKRLKIDDSTVVLDPWDYGVDGEETQERHTQVCRYQCRYHY